MAIFIYQFSCICFHVAAYDKLVTRLLLCSKSRRFINFFLLHRAFLSTFIVILMINDKYWLSEMKKILNKMTSRRFYCSHVGRGIRCAFYSLSSMANVNSWLQKVKFLVMGLSIPWQFVLKYEKSLRYQSDLV